MDAFNIELYRLPPGFIAALEAVDDETWEIISDEINRDFIEALQLEEENPDFGDDL